MARERTRPNISVYEFLLNEVEVHNADKGVIRAHKSAVASSIPRTTWSLFPLGSLSGLEDCPLPRMDPGSLESAPVPM
jgi:hypothetical protein